jgi:hypothetical protein
MVQGGLMRVEEAREALGMPDTSKLEDLATSDLNFTRTILERIIEKKIYIRPTFMQDLPLAILQAKSYYLLIAQAEEPDMETLDLLERYALECQKMLEQQQPPPPPPAPGPGGPPPMPGGPGGPMPQ